MSGYHKREIKRGVIGELSKIYEEIEEVKDSEEQGATVMVLMELSDVIGAIELYLEKNHPTITLEDLKKMNKITRRAFESGERN